MAEERIIFPARPLFIVDRGWQRSRKKAPTNPRSIKDDVQTICVTGATSLRTENPSDFQLASPLMKLKGSRKREHTNDPPLPTIQSLPYDAAQMKETRSSKRTRHFAVENKTSATVSDPSLAAPPVLPSNRTPASAIPLIFENPISGSATPLYTVIDPEATAFQHFVGYCGFASFEHCARMINLCGRPDSNRFWRIPDQQVRPVAVKPDSSILVSGSYHRRPSTTHHPLLYSSESPFRSRASKFSRFGNAPQSHSRPSQPPDPKWQIFR